MSSAELMKMKIDEPPQHGGLREWNPDVDDPELHQKLESSFRAAPDHKPSYVNCSWYGKVVQWTRANSPDDVLLIQYALGAACPASRDINFYEKRIDKDSPLIKFFADIGTSIDVLKQNPLMANQLWYAIRDVSEGKIFQD